MSNSDQQGQAFSDREKKIAWFLFPFLIIGLATTWFLLNSPRVGQLNKMLASNQELASYPYSFRVFAVEGETAVMSSPRSPESSVLQALKIIHPDMSFSDPNSEPVIAVQKELARLQYKAKDLVLAQPDISEVRWELDRAWLRSHGAIVDMGK